MSLELKFVTGNILDSDSEMILNTVNTVGVMGAGLALAFKNRYPEIMGPYIAHCRKANMKVKDFGIHCMKFDRVVCNFATKEHWKNNSELSYIRKGLIHLRNYIVENDIKTISIPPLGCSLGRLDQRQVLHLIIYHLKFVKHDLEVTLYNFDKIPSWLVMHLKDYDLHHRMYPRFTSVGSRDTDDQAVKLYSSALATIYGADPNFLMCTGDAFKGGDKLSWKYYVGNKQRFGPPGRDRYMIDVKVVPPETEYYAKARVIAKLLHGGWDYMSEFAQGLHTRNVFQVLGVKLTRPSEFLLCWTPDGAENTTGKQTGGTGTAIRIANRFGIPVFNLKNEDCIDRLKTFLDIDTVVS